MPFCPLLKKECIEHKCAFYTNLVGKDPQTNQDVNNWGCAIAFIPLIQIETSNQIRQSTASVDELRSESDKIGRAQCQIMAEMMKNQIQPAQVELLPHEDQ